MSSTVDTILCVALAGMAMLNCYALLKERRWYWATVAVYWLIVSVRWAVTGL